MTLDKIIEKAYQLIYRRRVEQIEEGVYNVVGEHGTYTVVRGLDGSITCNCLGFASRKKCSHSLAVIMLSNPHLLRSIERELRKEDRWRKAKR
ncbi:MAG: hypothetical protein N3E47_04890 [Candidatus Bathyarchaeota archaeon]|nr:hypothetical protein [Candidatus Bathyarchaeota archaeon]